MKLNVAEGSYEPSYFFIQIETSDQLDTEISKHNQTFIHEYIHFLQDIFLSYNIRYNLFELRKFALVAHKASSQGFTRPFNDWDSDSEITGKQFEYTWGGYSFHESSRISALTSNFFTVEETGARVYQYTAELNGDVLYRIGARDMLEYIAHKIESKHWTVNEPEFPYKSMDRVFDYLELSAMPDICRLALVEFCLHNDNPFHHMLKIIEMIRGQGKSEILLNQETIEHSLKLIQWHSTGGFQETIKTKTQRRLAEIKTALDERFHHRNFSSISTWIDDVINFISENTCGELFFTELYKMNEAEFFTTISQILQTIGAPLVFNIKEECISILPVKYDNQQFIQFYAAHKFMDFIKNTHGTCPMCAFCENGPEGIMNDNCIQNAVLRGSDELLCPFGQLIKTYDLHGIT